MENGKKSISLLIHQLNSPFFRCKTAYCRAINDDGYILEHYRKDYVEEDSLIQLLNKSIVCPSIRYLLPDILYFTHEHSITDRVFLVCSKYPGRYRETLLNLLAHMWLSQTQLNKLTQLIDAPEAFCKLFVLYAENESLDLDTFISFLKMNNNYLKKVDLNGLIKENNVCISHEKVNALNELLGNA